MLSKATGSVSKGTLSALHEVIGSKSREIAGDDSVTNGNEERCPWQHRNFNSKTLSQSSFAPYLTDNRSTLNFTSGVFSSKTLLSY